MMTRRMGLVAVLCVLTAIVTYPQVLSFRSAVHDFGDPLLNAWALCWVPHALITQPLSLFDANIFYPQHGTLAFSETLIAPAVMVAPLRALDANGIVLHNVTLFSGYVLSGLSMFALVRYLTDDDRAAIVSAVLFTITPLRAEHYPRVQLQLTYLLPLVLLYTYKVIDGGPRRARHAVLLGMCLGLQFYSCVYYTIFVATLVPVMAGVYLVCRRDGKAVAIKWLSIAAVTCAMLVAPAAPVYLANHRDVGDRALRDVQQGSAESRDYVRPTPTNWFYGGRPGGPAERHLFGGYVPVALAVAGVMAPPVRWLPLAAGALVAWDVSRGLNGWSYGTLNRYLLPYRALRVPARMAMLLTMIVVALAGLGCARLLALTRSITVRNVAVLALIGGAVLESLNRPLELRVMERGAPAVY